MVAGEVPLGGAVGPDVRDTVALALVPAEDEIIASTRCSGRVVETALPWARSEMR